MCNIAGFFVTLSALTSIFHLTAISIERRFVVRHPYKARIWMSRKIYAIYVVLPSWLCGLFWALCPLLGWSSYVREHRNVHRFSINISGNDANHLSYSYNLMFWCYVVPVFLMGFCCHDIKIALRSLHVDRADLGIPEQMMVLRKAKERRLTWMTIAMMVTFLCAWTPYAVCLLLITAEVQISSGIFAFAAVFAKLSTLYNPVIYMIFIKEFRTRLLKMFHLDPSNVVVPQQQSPKITLADKEDSGYAAKLSYPSISRSPTC